MAMMHRPRQQPIRRTSAFLPRYCSLLLFLVALAFQSAQAFWSSAETEDGKKEALDTKKERATQENVEVPVEYGVDVSFPIQHDMASTNYAWLPHNVDPKNNPTPAKYKNMAVQPLGDRQAAYREFIDGCVKKFGSKGRRCLETEQDRFEMSLRQPQSMQNYTEMGFKKIKAPEYLFKLLQNFWETNRHLQKEEVWGVGNTYTNNWASPTSMVSVEDGSLRNGGYRLKQALWDSARDTIQEWTGQELTQCSLYGIRVYKTGAILATHVDRLPLVSSAIINVDQDLDEPWPLEVYGHDGKAYNVTMEPGDMVLYESHSVLHGRPFPLKGRFMANIFIHFEPTGHSLRHNAALEEQGYVDVNAKYKDAVKRGLGGHEAADTGLPPYIIPNTPEVPNWRAQHPEGYHQPGRASEDVVEADEFETGSTMAHIAAQNGSLKTLKEEVQRERAIVNKKDKNGWTPLHEGVRAGHLDVVKYLIENGADANATTLGEGGSPLWLAKQTHEADHPIIAFLEEIGAIEVGPEL